VTALPPNGNGPLLVDAFCGEGGTSAGLARAGFRVVGIDNARRRLARYPFPSVEGDALEVLARLIDGDPVTFTSNAGETITATNADVAAYAGGPPCTGYSRGTVALVDRLTRYDRLIPATRALFEATGRPYVIENVESADTLAELRHPIRLCGTEFGLVTEDDDGTPLHLRRHRLFESPVMLLGAGGCQHRRGVQWAGVYGGARRDKVEARTVRKGGYVPPSLDVLRALVGAPWMTEEGCFLSIPPVYTEHLGAQLLEAVAA
jgi:DNA (cytosine-5)-methyltransferase 1